MSEFASHDEQILIKEAERFLQSTKTCSVLIDGFNLGNCVQHISLKPVFSEDVVPMCVELMKTGCVDVIAIHAWEKLPVKSKTEPTGQRVFSGDKKLLRQHAQTYQVRVKLLNPKTD